MPRTRSEAVSAEQIAEMADQGEDISAHFTQVFRRGATMVQRVNVDFSVPMLQELDQQAEALNISRQAVIKSMLREALDRRLSVEANRRAK